MKYDCECFQRPARRLEEHREEIITRRGLPILAQLARCETSRRERLYFSLTLSLFSLSSFLLFIAFRLSLHLFPSLLARLSGRLARRRPGRRFPIEFDLDKNLPRRRISRNRELGRRESCVELLSRTSLWLSSGILK